MDTTRVGGRRKVTVVGAGMVGGTVAQLLALRDYVDVVLVDIVEGLPQGKALDLMQVGPVLDGDGEELVGRGIGVPRHRVGDAAHQVQDRRRDVGVGGAVGSMVIYLAGLKDIPLHLYEAARLDGAGPWARLRYVTLPLLSPTISPKCWAPRISSSR